MADLSLGKTAVTYSGAAVSYTIAQEKVLTVKLWGGAGGGGVYGGNTVDQRGGSGAFVRALFAVKPGDVVEVRVGQGGQRAPENQPGPGGWPDGGLGGYNTSGGGSCGGGGGSTRLYINGVLKAIAAGGGGGFHSSGGSGGGLVGGAGWGDQAGVGVVGTGGTQTAGGTNPQTGYAGSALQGGNSGTNATSNAGAGGGGGFYGGAPGWAGSGGGGSSWAASGSDPTYAMGDKGSAPMSDDADYVSGIALGGVTGRDYRSQPTSGGNGLAVLNLGDPTASDLPAGKTIMDYSGRRILYTATYDATLAFKLWGAGGAGSIWAGGSAYASKGGGGGYLAGSLPVVAGDLIEIRVGQGGQGGVSTPTGSRIGGLGGWPDGGSGSTQGHPVYMGGGGGSTRLYKNGVLMAIAGAGGGSGLGDTNINGGGGGGLDGVGGMTSPGNVTADFNGNNYRGRGASQTAGGTNSQQPTYAGASLKGGDGFNAGAGQTAASSLNPGAGAGGGGGYYGGAGSSTTNGWPPGAGGGSSWTHASVTNVINTAAPTTANTGAAANNNDIDCTPTVGQGAASSAAATGTPGGDGRAVLITPPPPPPPLFARGNTTTTANYIGQAQTINIETTGTLVVRMWGGGGGGSQTPSNGSGGFGGVGGYTTIKCPVVAGDVCTIEVGQGGKAPVANGVAAEKSYPDGGQGGFYTATSNNNGSGGGSTRLYKNGTLIAVAGGGGGAGEQSSGGSGGGAAGANGIGGTPATGGTQTAGGTSPNTRSAAGYLKGGDSYSDNRAGGGGGGGYYGGGNGGTTNYGGTGGGGGSGFVSPTISGTTAQGVGQTPAGSPATGIAAAGIGGKTSYSAVTNGGDGQAIITVQEPVPPTPLVKGTPTTAAYTGDFVEYSVPSAGVITLDLWGGGGGGGYSSGMLGRSGGGAGYTRIKRAVAAGDIIKVEVAQGGRAPTTTTDTPKGGWPDGGDGTYISTYVGGGGGGSSRVYLNGVLLGVAGGGGGGMHRAGGAGGGRYGRWSPDAWSAQGGSQSAGGRSNGALVEPAQFRGGASVSNSNFASGGGGGGYYGGGVSPTGTAQYSGGGGGSGYAAPDSQCLLLTAPEATGQNVSAPAAGTPPTSTVGQGGQGGTTTFANIKNGGDGLVVLSLTDVVTPSLPTGKTVIPFTGERLRYRAPNAGAISLKAWGGAGGGGVWYNGYDRDAISGAGGSAFGTIEVVANDLIEIEVGSGGQGGISGTGGFGGWPDGGNGGGGGSNLTTAGGGGGGSTRVYKNGVLILVAAGGGGAQYDSGYKGGPGGGLSGVNGSGSPAATGGTQTAGGVNTADTTRNGASLKGGNAYTTPNDASNEGGGGGGGYYGGAGGRANGGGGGSSYAHTSVAGASLTGQTFGATTAPRATDTDYPAGAAKPVLKNSYGAGSARRDPAASGGDGALVMTYAATVSDLTPGKTAFTSDGLSKTVNVTQAGLIRIKMWGGGGSGYTRASAQGNPTYGGAGGFAYAELVVVPGDVLKVETAGGGKQNPYNASEPGLGGWPDGGQGGTSSLYNYAGSGGGSSRIWLNGVLQIVAGGGGGSTDFRSATRSGQGGAGGGLKGLNGVGDPAYLGTGGTQTTGGVNNYRPTDTLSAGAYLKGGAGYRTGATAATQDSTNSGAGGGGGYYGGGGSAGLAGSSSSGAGGGSSYAGPQARNPLLIAGSAQTPARTTDPDYVAGVAAGGPQVTATLTPVNGGDGLIVLNFEVGGKLPQFNTGDKITAPYTGASNDVQVVADGTLMIHMWGAGGGGSQYISNTLVSPGGAGGYTQGYIAVYAGDFVRYETGGPASRITPTSAGLGGWPDGGNGGFYNGSRKGGGGGGSSRVYVNGVLVAVAGGGGGSAVGQSASAPQIGGGGGGLSGGDGGSAASAGKGGTQSAGGAASNAAKAGAKLQGGNGYVAPASPTENPSSANEMGAGGGGGYYGGGGGYAMYTATASLAAGGGSGYLATSVTGSTEASTTEIPKGTNQSVYQDGVGVGSPGSSQTDAADSTASGPGLIVLSLTAGGPVIPGNVDITSIGTVTVASSPNGSAVGTKSAAFNVASLPTIVLTAPNAIAQVLGGASGDLGPAIAITQVPTGSATGGVGAELPIIYVTGDLGGQPQNEALVVTGVINDDIAYPTAPAVYLEAATNYDVRVMPQVKVQAMNYILGAGHEFFDPIVIQVSAPQGMGYLTELYEAVIDSVITVETPVAAGSGDSNFSFGNAQAFAFVRIQAPAGDLAGDDVTTPVDLGTSIQVISPEGEAFKPVFYSTNPYVNDVNVSIEDGGAQGGANAIVYNAGQPFAVVRLFAPTPHPEVEAAISRDLGLVIIGQPRAAYSLRADVRVNYFDRIFVKQPAGLAAELTASIVDGDLSNSVITLTAPESRGSGGYALRAPLPTVYMRPTEAYVEDAIGIHVSGADSIIRFKRALASGGAPLTLEKNEIALNEHDGLLFAPDDAGVVRANHLGGFATGGVAPAGGAPGEVLYADGTWRPAAPVYTRPVRLPPPTGRLHLTDQAIGMAGGTPPTGKVVYHPFFLPRPVTFVRFGVTVDEVASGSVRLGVCTWDAAAQAPGVILMRAEVSGAGITGPRVVAETVELAAGWHATLVQGVGAAPRLTAVQAPFARDDSFNPVGDPSAAGLFQEAPAPTGFEALSLGYVWAER